MLVKALWNITDQHVVFLDTAAKRPCVIPGPSAWDHYQGYNEMKQKWQKEMPMQSSVLQSHADCLSSLCLKPYMNSPQFSQLNNDIEDLVNCYVKYITVPSLAIIRGAQRPAPLKVRPALFLSRSWRPSISAG